MRMNRTARRLTAGLLIVLGAVLMALAAEAWLGLLLLGLGVVLEAAGIALERKS